MSDLKVDIHSSGFVGVGVDTPIKKIEQETLIGKQEDKREVNAHKVAETVDEVNDFLKRMDHNLSFSVDEDTGDSIIIIKDSENDEVIRQIPSEELLVIRKKMDYLIGILFEDKV